MQLQQFEQKNRGRGGGDNVYPIKQGAAVHTVVVPHRRGRATVSSSSSMTLSINIANHCVQSVLTTAFALSLSPLYKQQRESLAESAIPYRYTVLRYYACKLIRR